MLNPEQPPELAVAKWLNTDAPPTLAALKGKVVVLAAFQMLCPGSAKHLVPQAQRLAENFSGDEVAVVGLHMVFERHNEMTPDRLKDFLAENEITFPVGIDQPNGKHMPKTMESYEIQGTPTILVFDRQGRLRRHYLGGVDDVRIAAEVMALALEDRNAPREVSVAIERRLHAVLVDPEDAERHAHGHDHHLHAGGGCCGGGGHHHHDHDHDHNHADGGGCCGGKGHDHAHGHSHDHAPARSVAAAGATAASGAQSGDCKGDGSCGCH